MSKAADLDARLVYWQDELGKLEAKNRKQVAKALNRSIGETLRDLRSAYSQFNPVEKGELSDGKVSNRYSIQSQTQNYKRLIKAADGLLSPKTISELSKVYKDDLNEAYQTGGKSAQDLRKIIGESGASVNAQVSSMPVAAQFAAGQRLNDFWSKEKAALRDQVTEAVLGALQRGKGWSGAQRDIANALRSSGQTILRGTDELSRTAKGGIVMNLEQRAELISKTELARAWVQGQMEQYRRGGYNFGRWSANGERSCPFCSSREGVIYTLDDLEAAIPAHPRCRCTVSPVEDSAMKKVQNAKDKEAAATEWLDDAGWTAIRQQRINEHLEFTGKKDLDPSKWLNTPTSLEKYIKGANAKAAKPAWMPSGQAVPDLDAVAKAAERALEQDDLELEEERDLEEQRKEAEREAALLAKKEAKRKAEEQQAEETSRVSREVQRLKEEIAAKRGELKVIDAELDPILKRNNQLKKDREALQKERTLRNDLQRELRLAQEAAEPATQRKSQAFMSKFSAESELKALREKLANVKPGKKGDKFNIDQYDGAIAVMNHDLATLKLIGEDVLRRAGVTMEQVKTPVSGAINQDTMDALKREKATATAYIERYKKNLAISRKNIRTLESNAEYAMDRAKRALERGDIDQATYDERIRVIKKNTQEGKAKEQNYIDNEVPRKIKEWQDKQAAAEAKISAANQTSSAGASQQVIDELVRTSPITRADAEKLVKEAASTAARKKDMAKGRFSSLRPIPKDQGLDSMIDAVHMYGTRSSMDSYGLSSERAHASARKTDPRTGAYRYDSSGYVNSGKGYGDFRGTQFHELGHHLEAQNSDFYRAAREFMKQRVEAAGMEIGRTEWLGGNYGRNELGYGKAKSYNPYVLKEYDTGRLNQYGGQLDPKEVNGWQTAKDYTSVHQKASLATEVVSMGVEKLSSAANLQRLAEMDSEHLLLSLGVVKVQQARARLKMDRVRGDQAANTPITKKAEIPEGSTGTVDAEAVKKSIRREIDDLEGKAKKLADDFEKANAEEKRLTSKSSKVFNELSKMRQLEEIIAAQEALEDQSMALWNEKSPLEKGRRQIEVDLENLEKQIKALQESSKR